MPFKNSIFEINIITSENMIKILENTRKNNTLPPYFKSYSSVADSEITSCKSHISNSINELKIRMKLEKLGLKLE